MKKILSFVLTLTLLLTYLCGASFADSFPLHSGITFGMSEDEVKELEASNGFTLSSKYIGEILLFLRKGELDFVDNKIMELSGVDNQLFSEGSVAGIDGSEILYNFNKNGLCSVVYYLGVNGKSDSSRFTTLSNQINKKYGESICSGSNFIDFPLDGLSCITMYRINDYYFNLADRKITLEGFEQWAIPTDGGYVIIMLLGILSPAKIVFVSYNFISEETFQTYVQNKLNDQEQKEEQLNNDI